MHTNASKPCETPASIMAELGIPAPDLDNPPTWFTARLDAQQIAVLGKLTAAAGGLPPLDSGDGLRLMKVALGMARGEVLDGAPAYLASLAARILAGEVLKAALIEKLGLGPAQAGATH